MVYEKVKCPYCGSEDVVRNGKSPTGRPIEVEIHNAFVNPDEGLPVEMDEMWSYYHDKSHQVWLWRAIDHDTGVLIAFVFGTREYKYLDELLELLKPFSIGVVYADNNFAYSSRVPEENLVTGKKNTQKIERHHLTLRTRIKRLARKSICFSKSLWIHKTVIGLFIDIFYFALPMDLSTVL